MEVKLVGPQTVELVGTKEEFGLVAAGAEALAAADRQDEIRGGSDTVREDHVDSLRDRLSVVADGRGRRTAHITTGMAATAFKGAELAAEAARELLAVVGSDLRVIADPLSQRRLGFLGVVKDFSEGVGGQVAGIDPPKPTEDQEQKS